jgi:hypothetical protein
MNRQAEYGHEKRNFSGGKGDSHILLSGNRQVTNYLLSFYFRVCSNYFSF